MSDMDKVFQEENDARRLEDTLDMLAEQEQDRDFHRATADLERLLVKVETGMAVREDADEIRKLVKMIGG